MNSNLKWLRPRKNWPVYLYGHKDVANTFLLDKDFVNKDILQCLRYCKKYSKKMDARWSPLANIGLLFVSLVLAGLGLLLAYIIIGQVGDPLVVFFICLVISLVIVFGISRLIMRRMEYKFFERRLRLKVYKHAQFWSGYCDDIDFHPYFISRYDYDEVDTVDEWPGQNIAQNDEEEDDDYPEECEDDEFDFTIYDSYLLSSEDEISDFRLEYDYSNYYKKSESDILDASEESLGTDSTDIPEELEESDVLDVSEGSVNSDASDVPEEPDVSDAASIAEESDLLENSGALDEINESGQANGPGLMSNQSCSSDEFSHFLKLLENFE